MRGRSRILSRIVLPFVLLFALATCVSWVLSSTLVSFYMERTLRSQMGQVADIMSRSGFINNPHVYRELKELIRSDIVLYDNAGQALATTFSAEEVPPVPAKMLQTIAGGQGPFHVSEIKLPQGSFHTVFSHITTPALGSGILSLWTPTHEWFRLRNSIIWGTGIISILGMIAVAFLSYWIARSITAPVEDLVAATRSFNLEGVKRKARVSSRDEIGLLAQSYNEMIDKLSEYEERLIESERLATAGRMAAGLAHEIRNPLTSIKMLAQVLAGRLRDHGDHQEILGSLISEIDRLEGIIQAIMDRARPGELVSERASINEQAEAVARLASRSFKGDRVSISLDLSTDLPPLRMDSGKIQQVLWNLLVNARDAMPRGGEVTVSSRMLPENRVEVAVRDRGPGFADQSSDRLFQPFFTTKPEGMGLGLTISRKIVEKHGGELLLENHPDGGAWVRLILPAADAGDS